MTARLTDCARKALAVAKRRERCRRWGEASSRAVLLALLEGEGLAAQVLRNAGIEPGSLRERLVALPPPAPGLPTARNVVERAVAEARWLGQNYVGSEHLLLGLTRLETSPASRALAEAGLDRARAAAEATATWEAWDRSRPSWPRRWGAVCRAAYRWMRGSR